VNRDVSGTLQQGYAHVWAEEIVAAAGVTRGALYHRFAGKQELFRAVFEKLEGEVTAEIAAAIAVAPTGRRAWSSG
jgi:AcrR family transcriptional regulator